MPISRKLQSKISRTKKRLSSEQWLGICIPIATFVVLAAAFTGYRLTSLPKDYSMVRGDIPVVPVKLNDPTLRTFEETPERVIDDTTAAIVIDDEGNLFFGSVKAFGQEYQNVRNKYVVKAHDGSPQTAELLKVMQRWLNDQATATRRKSNGVAILIPSSRIPMSVVIKVMAELRYSDLFDRVVLGNGLM